MQNLKKKSDPIIDTPPLFRNNLNNLYRTGPIRIDCNCMHLICSSLIAICANNLLTFECFALKTIFFLWKLKHWKNVSCQFCVWNMNTYEWRKWMDICKFNLTDSSYFVWNLTARTTHQCNYSLQWYRHATFFFTK